VCEPKPYQVVTTRTQHSGFSAHPIPNTNLAGSAEHCSSHWACKACHCTHGVHPRTGASCSADRKALHTLKHTVATHRVRHCRPMRDRAATPQPWWSVLRAATAKQQPVPCPFRDRNAHVQTLQYAMMSSCRAAQCHADTHPHAPGGCTAVLVMWPAAPCLSLCWDRGQESKRQPGAQQPRSQRMDTRPEPTNEQRTHPRRSQCAACRRGPHPTGQPWPHTMVAAEIRGCALKCKVCFEDWNSERQSRVRVREQKP
jgi:hypothetical protein